MKRDIKAAVHPHCRMMVFFGQKSVRILSQEERCGK